MGKQETYELLEDFIRETKNNNVKKIFFNLSNVRDEGNPNHMVARISMSALSKDGKEYYSHMKIASEILLSDKTTQEESNAFIMKGRNEMEEYLKIMQDKYPTAEMVAGVCMPNGA